LPSFGDYTSPDEDPARAHLRYCNDCLRPSDHVRSYSLFTIIFLVIFIVWRFDTILKCPSCARRHILVRLPLTILLANLLCPIVVVWWAVVFVRTLFVGDGWGDDAV
jgi:hypothetical protein